MILTDVETITDKNVCDVLKKALITHETNRYQIDYLYKYYKGDQPILKRVKEIREEINNKIVENRANEIVSFKVGYLCGEPIQYVSRGGDDSVSDAINALNEFVFAEDKALPIGAGRVIVVVAVFIPFVGPELHVVRAVVPAGGADLQREDVAVFGQQQPTVAGFIYQDALQLSAYPYQPSVFARVDDGSVAGTIKKSEFDGSGRCLCVETDAFCRSPLRLHQIEPIEVGCDFPDGFDGLAEFG